MTEQSQQEPPLPETTVENIQEIMALTNVEYDVLVKEYREILSDPYFESDQFKTAEEKYRYADGVLWARYRGRRPAKEVTVIPIGFDGVRVTKSGDKRSTIYVIVMGQDGKPSKSSISLLNENNDVYKSINYGQRYKVKLVEYKFGYGADNRTKFENPELVGRDLLSLFRLVGTKEITDLQSAAKYPSQRQKTSTGEWVDRTDWRVVRGFITRMNQFARKDGTLAGVYNLIDQSLGTEPSVNEAGQVVSPSFTVWTDPILMKYGVESEVYAVGTISLDAKTSIPSMNAIQIIPIHAREVKQ